MGYTAPLLNIWVQMILGLLECGLQTFGPCATLVVESERSLATTRCGFASGLGRAGAEVATTEVGATSLGG